MRASADRSIRFVFDEVADVYLSGRPDMPVEAVRWGMEAAGLAPGARVLEIGAGGGQLTVALLEAGLEVVALEPGAALRARAERRASAARFVAATFEEFESDGRFDAVVASNAFHWLDPADGYAKAADLGAALVLLWDTAFPADAALHRRLQRELMAPRGSTFPDDEAGIRAMIERDSAAGRDELRASGRFAEPRWRVFERLLRYTPERYVSFVLSLGGVASQPEHVRLELAGALRDFLGEEPFELRDVVYVVAARSAE